jgi:hypothetical protein
MEQAPRSGVPGPAPGAWPDAVTAPPDEVPEVADAVGARAVDLRRIAEELDGAGVTVSDDLAGALRAHAGHVDALAEHLRDAGAGEVPPPDGDRSP